MTTSPTPFLSEITDLAAKLPQARLDYFRARLKARLHAFILAEFLKLQQKTGFNKADLARRLGKRPEQITRWFANPGNMEIETVSDLLLGCGVEPRMYSQYLVDGAIKAASEDWKQPKASDSHDELSELPDMNVADAKPRPSDNVLPFKRRPDEPVTQSKSQDEGDMRLAKIG